MVVPYPIHAADCELMRPKVVMTLSAVLLMTCTAASPGNEPHLRRGTPRRACAPPALPGVPRALHAALAPLSVGRRSARSHVQVWAHAHAHTHARAHTCMRARADARGLIVARPCAGVFSRVSSTCLVPECTATPERGQHGLDRRCRGAVCPCHVFLSCGS